MSRRRETSPVVSNGVVLLVSLGDRRGGIFRPFCPEARDPLVAIDRPVRRSRTSPMAFLPASAGIRGAITDEMAVPLRRPGTWGAANWQTRMRRNSFDPLAGDSTSIPRRNSRRIMRRRAIDERDRFGNFSWHSFSQR